MLDDSLELVNTLMILSEAKLLRNEDIEFFGMDKEVVYNPFKYFSQYTYC